MPMGTFLPTGAVLFPPLLIVFAESGISGLHEALKVRFSIGELYGHFIANLLFY